MGVSVGCCQSSAHASNARRCQQYRVEWPVSLPQSEESLPADDDIEDIGSST